MKFAALDSLRRLFARCFGRSQPVSRRAVRSRRLSIDPLESRQMLAVAPELVRDINLVPGSNGSSSPQNLLQVGSFFYFTATDIQNGAELWKSDGTCAGTTLVKDILPGVNGASIAELTNVAGTLYFEASDGSTGLELWKSDGTSSGTTLVRDIRPGVTSAGLNSLTNVNGTLYFVSNDGSNGSELWVSNGTSDGTFLVRNINPGANDASPDNLINVNGILYFRANDGSAGRELWKSDGTSTGTILVKDIFPGTTGGLSTILGAVNGTLYLQATEGINGYELWKTDGTCNGTVLVKDINAGTGNASLGSSVIVNNTLYFRADDGSHGGELWKSDGSSSGTQLVKDANPGTGNGFGSQSENVNGVLFFRGNDGATGYELWKSDGTSTGTMLVKDIRAGATQSFMSELTNLNGRLLFSANGGVGGTELWLSDGTSSGTILVKDIQTSGTGNSNPRYLLNFNGELFFRAVSSVLGYELWKSDGTSSGTMLVKDINSPTRSSSPYFFANLNGQLYFQANDGTNGSELWRSDGTSTGTLLLRDISTGGGSASPSLLTEANGTLYFSANNTVNGRELWKSDGTSSGTVIVSDISPGLTSTNINFLVNVNGRLYFQASDGSNGAELWKSDGTSSGTVLVKDILPGASGGNPGSLTNVNGTLYFRAADGSNGYELWKSDGTSAGTVLVKDIFPGTSGGSPRDLTNVNGTLYFRAIDGSNGYELWKSDGTSSGTVLVKDISPGTNDGSPRYLTNVNGTLYFRASDGSNGYELWKSDGTSTGTTLVKDIAPGADNASPRYLTNVNGILYFRANNGTTGYELWKSDGTSAGTVLVKDILSGPSGSTPQRLTNFLGTLVFSASNGSGLEVWASDGTSSGTTLLGEINPGPGSANSTNFTVVGTKLFFAADDGTGTELWTLAEVIPQVTLSVTGSPLAENAGSATVTATLSASYSQTVTVNLAVTGSATLNTDYSASALSIAIPAGQTTGSITLTGLDDPTHEGDESIVVDVASVTNGTENGTQSVTVTLADNDAQPSVSLTLVGSSLVENGGVDTVRATLSNPSTQDVTVTLGFTGSATNNTDYSASSNAIVILAGQTSGSVTLTGIDDATFEGTETAIVDVTTVINGTENGTQSVTASISDDETQPSVNLVLNGSTLAENGGLATVRATLSNPSTQDVTVNLGFTGTATSNSDYSASSNTIIILAGQTSGSITLTGINDATFEGNESIVVDVIGVTNGTENGTQSVTATITDDDATPNITLSLDNSTLAENSGVASVTATLSNPSTQDVTVALGFTGSATNNVDYSASSNTITILAGQTSGSITLTGINDTTFEGSESIVVDVIGVTNGTENGTQSVAATITDDDAQPSVSLVLANSPLPENGGVATVRATLSNPSTQNVTVTLDFTGSATNNVDYSASSNTIVILAGQTSGSITFTGIDDITFEGNESFIVDVTGVTNGSENNTQSVTATITDDDVQPSVSLTLSNSPLAENGGVATVRATLSNPSTQDVSVTLGFTGSATSNTDYAASSNVITILAGQTSSSITLAGINDATFEGNESIVVDVIGVTNGSENGVQQVTATISDDDSAPSVTLSLSGSPLAENGGIATVRATLSNPSTQAVTVNLGLSGTATNNSDYSASGTTIVVPAGSFTGAVTLIGLDDATFEGSESIVIDVINVTNGTEHSVQQVTATINDDDVVPTVTLALTGSPIAENGGIATVIATLASPFAQPVTVNLGLSGTATHNSDYSASSTSIVILAGSLTGAVTLIGLNDATFEGDELIVVDVTGVINATEHGVQQVTATITDDDTAGLSPGIAAPLVDLNGPAANFSNTVTYTENNPPVVIPTSTATLTDIDSNSLLSVTATLLTAPDGTSEVLSAVTAGTSINASYNSTTRMLTLMGPDSAVNFQQVLRSVAYQNTSEVPTTTARLVRFVASDGGNLSVARDATVNIVAVNDVPSASGTTTPLSYVENDGPTVIFPDVTTNDPDSMYYIGGTLSAGLTRATISISPYVVGQDVLSYTNVGIPGSFNSTTGVFTLNGTATLSRYNDALRLVTYRNTSDNPNATPRVFTLTVFDSTAPSVTLSRTLNITSVNDAAIADLSGPAAVGNNFSTTYRTSVGTTPIAYTTSTVTDLDHTTMTSLTVTITNVQNASNEVLTYTLPGGISASAPSNTASTIVFTGVASPATYQTLLRSIAYRNLAASPILGTPRSITVVTDDGTSTLTSTTTVTLVSPLQAAGNPAKVVAEKITTAQLQSIVQAAIGRWSTLGLKPAQKSVLQSTTYVVANIGLARELGQAASGKVITIDDNAAGFGWFVDKTPRDDKEFTKAISKSERVAPGMTRMDLLTVVMHEMGHILGLPDIDDDHSTGVMTDVIAAGTRRVATQADLKAIAFYLSQNATSSNAPLRNTDVARADVFARWS